MFENYLKITFRNIKKHKGYSLINILGLAIAISVFILIALYVQYELSYDKYHKNAARIYRITTDFQRGGTVRKMSGVPSPAGPTFTENIPEIESFTWVFDLLAFRSSAIIKYKENRFEEKGMILANETFFKIFSYQFVSGNPETVLIEPGSVVITETTADRLFGKDEPIGKAICLEDIYNISGTFKVTGVIKDVPKNSHFKFNYVFPYISSTTRFRDVTRNNWISNPFKTYILVKNDVNIRQLEQKINEVYKQKKGEYSVAPGTGKNFYLQKLTDIHLKSHLETFGIDLSNFDELAEEALNQ